VSIRAALKGCGPTYVGLPSSRSARAGPNSRGPSVSIRAALRGVGPAAAGLPSSRSAWAGPNSRPLAAQTVCRLLSAAERYLGLPQFARRMDPDGLVGVGRENTRVSLQARRVVVDVNHLISERYRGAVWLAPKGIDAQRADLSRRVAAAVISGRAQAGGPAGDWGYGARPGPPPKALHPRSTISNHKQTPNDHHRRAASSSPPKEPHRPTRARARMSVCYHPTRAMSP
jgi:hypothetical protein